ncbi:putative metalloprotease arx1 [Neolecta irregularis DAH-3]|uniref:Probable metalloprotease ARX1 n=1 Tax=Neolecta irregularis (strain DAH-3) TaxID=1198029 RepID=A0A1U7LN93_NEOID|nr:putative metalloprotease arx1 [Neolecta irregularis DAH-3]|eukprot:OLL24140.1 putative metalloprotease arx1 [Neolecta irregularis DAH-3]
MDIINSDNILSDTVAQKYRLAGSFASLVLDQITRQAVCATSTWTLCKLGDSLILDLCAKVYKTARYEKGIAEPTTISPQNCFLGYAPEQEQGAYILQVGDVVKISLGVHIDGYAALTCHTMVIPPVPAAPLTGPPANALCAVHYTIEALIKLLGSSNPSNPVTAKIIRDLVDEAAESFQVGIVTGSRVLRIRRFLTGQQTIFEDDAKIVEWTGTDDSSDWQVEIGEAWLLDIRMTTGPNKIRKHADLKSTIFTRDVVNPYPPKLKTSKSLLSEINSVFPINQTFLKTPRARLGIQELVSHGILMATPVLCDSESSIVARQVTTILLLKTQVLRLITPLKPSWIQSPFEIKQTGIIARHLESKVKVRQVDPTTLDKMDTT